MDSKLPRSGPCSMGAQPRGDLWGLHLDLIVFFTKKYFKISKKREWNKRCKQKVLKDM